MTTEAEAKKALDEREKALAAREKELDEREKALPKSAPKEDDTPYPTQAMNDARARGEWDGDSSTYKTRVAKAD